MAAIQLWYTFLNQFSVTDLKQYKIIISYNSMSWLSGSPASSPCSHSCRYSTTESVGSSAWLGHLWWVPPSPCGLWSSRSLEWASHLTTAILHEGKPQCVYAFPIGLSKWHDQDHVGGEPTRKMNSGKCDSLDSISITVHHVIHLLNFYLYKNAGICNHIKILWQVIKKIELKFS